MNRLEALKILGIEEDEARSLTLPKLRKHYLRSALATHPDKNHNTSTASENFKRLQEAYSIISQEHSFDQQKDQCSPTCTLDEDQLNKILKMAFNGENIEEYMKQYNIYRPSPLFGIDLSIPFDPPPSSSFHNNNHIKSTTTNNQQKSRDQAFPSETEMQRIFERAFEEAGLDAEGNPLEGWARPLGHDDSL